MSTVICDHQVSFFLYFQIVSIVKKKCPEIPLVLYINGNGGLLEKMKGTGVDVIGLDWTVDMADGRWRLGDDISIQGNVDPAYLFSPLPALTDEIHRLVLFLANTTFLVFLSGVMFVLSKIYDCVFMTGL